jgi:hypothetical protein
MSGKSELYDLSHSINHISFGKEDEIKNIKKAFPNSGILN